MKLETKYLGMSKLFKYPIKSYLKNLIGYLKSLDIPKYPIKSYLKNLTWCEML